MERLTHSNTGLLYCSFNCPMEHPTECAYHTGHTVLKCKEAQIYDKLTAYEDAEEQGRLVVLPNKEPRKHCFIIDCGEFIQEVEREQIILEPQIIHQYYRTNDGCAHYFTDSKNTIEYATIEAAESAIAERNGEK